MGYGGIHGSAVVQELDAGRVIGPGFSDSADPRTARDGFESQQQPLDEFEGLPPGYDGPPTPSGAESRSREQDPELVEAMQDRLNGEIGRPTSLTTAGSERNQGEGSVSPPPNPMTPLAEEEQGGKGRNSIEAGVSELARLRALKEERERLEEENNRRMTEGDSKNGVTV
jgi:hypothetical protein